MKRLEQQPSILNTTKMHLRQEKALCRGLPGGFKAKPVLDSDEGYDLLRWECRVPG
jgi:hypothetical protein